LRGEKLGIEKVRLEQAGEPAVTVFEKRTPFWISRIIE